MLYHDGAQGVRDVRQGHEPRPRRDQGLQLRLVEEAVLSVAGELEDAALALGEELMIRIIVIMINIQYE